MSDSIKIIVDGKPRGKDRPRFARKGKYICTYNSKQTQEYQSKVKIKAIEQCNSIIDKNYSGKLKVLIKAFFKPNKSISKKQYKLLIGQPYLKKPDIDNIAKIILDSLNNVAYKDDNQVYDLKVYKYYDEKERVEIYLEYED